MILMEDMSVNTFDNTDNMIPFKELQGKLVEKDNKVCSSIRSWRAFIRLRKQGFLKAGVDWKDKEFTDKHNHYVNPDRFLEEVKKLKHYSDIKLKSDTLITPITPPITPENEEEEKGNPSFRDNNDNAKSDSENASDNTYLEKYVSELEQDKKRFIREKDDMEKRFAMVFSGYDRTQKELYAAEKEVTKLRLQLGAGASHLSQSGVAEEKQHDEGEGAIPTTESATPPEGGQVAEVVRSTTPPQPAQIARHDEFVSPEANTPPSEPEPHTGEIFGEGEVPPAQDFGEAEGVVNTTSA